GKFTHEVRLYDRPYTFNALNELSGMSAELSKLPATLRADLLTALQKPFYERQEFYAMIAKRHAGLVNLLGEDETAVTGRAWRTEDRLEKRGGAEVTIQTRICGLPDILLQIEEVKRMTRKTL